MFHFIHTDLLSWCFGRQYELLLRSSKHPGLCNWLAGHLIHTEIWSNHVQSEAWRFFGMSCSETMPYLTSTGSFIAKEIKKQFISASQSVPPCSYRPSTVASWELGLLGLQWFALLTQGQEIHTSAHFLLLFIWSKDFKKDKIPGDHQFLSLAWSYWWVLNDHHNSTLARNGLDGPKMISCKAKPRVRCRNHFH